MGLIVSPDRPIILQPEEIVVSGNGGNASGVRAGEGIYYFSSNTNEPWLVGKTPYVF